MDHQVRHINYTRPPPGDDDPLDSDTSDDENGEGRGGNGKRVAQDASDKKECKSEFETEENVWPGHGQFRGISGLMKALIGNKTFSGGWEEYLSNCLSVFDTFSIV